MPTATHLPLQGRLNVRLSVAHYILNQINGQPQGLSLRLCGYFNIISAESSHISTTIQRLQTIKILYYIVGANCVRPFLGCCELTGDRRSPLRIVRIFLYHIIRESSYFINNPTAAASHRPTVWDIKFNLCFRPIFEGAVIFCITKND